MDLLDHIPHERRAAGHRPWPRIEVENAGWAAAIELLASRTCSLLGLWGDDGRVHMGLIGDMGSIVVVTLACKNGGFPSVGARHAPAIRLERTIASLFGFEPVGAPDQRPWIDLGFWDVADPLGRRETARPPQPYSFLPAEGEGLHQVPVGPVHAGIIEPGHFRFTANGEHVVRLEERLGYVHKGIEGLMCGAPLDRAAQLASRTSGDSTVAYAYAFAQAVEAALEVTPPSRATHLRALMAELERIANHFGDIGAICNDASFSLMHAQCAILREHVLRTADACFGHRLMMDAVVPGGVTRDLEPEGVARIRGLLAEIGRVLPALIELYDQTASLQDRTVTTGIVRADYARLYGAGGYIGRASGRAFDSRRSPGYAPYNALAFEVPVLEAGDVNARVWIRVREVEQSRLLIGQLLDGLPPGDLAAPLSVPAEPCEGMSLIEAFRGDVLAWVRLDMTGRVERCHLRDASWFQWPLLETAIEGNIVADFPLCNKSFNCSYSGHDL